jgi:hypothetical protein
MDHHRPSVAFSTIIQFTLDRSILLQVRDLHLLASGAVGSKATPAPVSRTINLSGVKR